MLPGGFSEQTLHAVYSHSSIIMRAAGEIDDPPAYRSTVRQLLLIAIQGRYWQTCHRQEGGNERYLFPCVASKEADPIDQTMIEEILGNPRLALLRREGTSVARVLDNALASDQSIAAQAAVEAIERAIGDSD